MSELPTSPEHHPFSPTLEDAAQTTLTLLLLLAALHLLRPASLGRQAAPLQHRCECRGRRGGPAHRGPDLGALAAGEDRAAGRRGLCPRGAHALVRAEPRRLRVRPGPQRSA